MSATELMVLAFVLAVVGRWAHGQKAIAGAGALVEIIFALLVVSALDQGRTKSIAMGFAWLFLAAVLLSNNSPLTALAKISNNNTIAGAATGGASGIVGGITAGAQVPPASSTAPGGHGTIGARPQ